MVDFGEKVDLWDLLIQIEGLASAIYKKFAEGLSRHPEATALFGEMSEEEKGHAAHLAALKREMEGAPHRQFYYDMEVAILKQLSKRLETYLAEIEKKELNFDEALEFALGLETEATEGYDTLFPLLKIAEPKVKQVLRKLHMEGIQHRQHLLDTYPRLKKIAEEEKKRKGSLK